ncbi:MAG: choice-of-anchor D domain-containing protein [Candidatus Eisenbacteria bacterium]
MSRSLRGLGLVIIFWSLLVGAAGEAWADGACCLTGGCIQTSSVNCLRIGGQFLGEDVPCDPNPCVPICGPDPSVIDFGRITVDTSRDLTFQVRNTGYVRAVGSYSESCQGFQFLGGTTYDLEPGESQIFTVRFLPTATGAFQCQVDGTVCDGPLLLGEGIAADPICLVIPTHLDFGAIGVGQFRDRSFTVRNAGDGLLVGGVSGCGAFSIVSGDTWELGASEERTVTVRFRPDGIGTFSCTLDTGEGCEDVTVIGVGEETPTCLVTPADLQFGDVVLGTPADRSFTIENTGSGTLSGTVRLNCAEFLLVGASGYNIQGGESQTFTVRYLPESEGESECLIDLGTGCEDLLAQGSGVRAPICLITPTFLDFGNVPLGSSLVESFRVTNYGGSDLIGTFVFDCDDFEVLSDPTYTIPPGDHLDFDVRFTPSALGGVICRLRGDGCDEYTLRGFGVIGPECRIEPTELDLGAVPVGTIAEAHFTLANDGGDILAGVATIEPMGSSASTYRFAATGGTTLAYSLAGGQELDVALELVAEGLGPADAEIVLGASGDDCPPVAVHAVVEIPPECSLSFGEWDFGTVLLGEVAETTLRLENTGGSRLVGEVSLDCESFALVAGVDPAQSSDPVPMRLLPRRDSLTYDLGAGEVMLVGLVFAPVEEGSFDCEVSFSEGCSPLSLSGVGQRAPICALSTTGIDFGIVDLEQFADASLFIENVGGGRLVGEVGSSCPSFFFIGDTHYNLGPGQSREIFVRFVPDRSGVVTCTLDAGPSCEPIIVRGVGNGPICVASPSVLRFGTVLPGTSRDLEFVVSNAGGGTLRGSVAEACSAYEIVSDGSYELRAGESKNITLRFSPHGSGISTCEVTLSGGCDGIDATGSGGDPPLCSLDVEALDFGEVALLEVVRRSFQISNLGEGRLQGQVSANCPGFRIIGVRSYDLGSGESQRFEVELTAFEEGILTCELDLGADCQRLDAFGDVRLPLGACCYADGFCELIGESACLGSGGVSWAEGVECDGASCLPLGACCAPDGSCTLTTEVDCLGAGGVSWEEGAGCAAGQCPPSGACCLESGQCVVVIEALCTNDFEGDYEGDGSNCSPSPCPRLGACCFPDGTCRITEEDGCTPAGGVSWGEGATCDGVSCEPVGACCSDTDVCSISTEAACLGSYLGDTSVCQPTTCIPFGACCTVDHECRIEREDLCDGTFLGEDAECEPNICSSKVEDVRVVSGDAGAEIEVVTTAGAVSELEGWYRVPGTFGYLQVPAFERRGDVWASTFDSAASSVRGVEYYLTYFDQTLQMRVSHGTQELPNRLRISGSLPVPFPNPGDFRMLAAPIEVSGGASLYSFLASRLGVTGPRTWKMGTWDPILGRYVLVDASNPQGFEAGRAYWFITATTPPALELSGRTQFPQDGSYTYSLRLLPGWNMIGNPAAYPIVCDPDRVFIADRGEISTLEDAASGANPRVSPLYTYAPDGSGAFAPYEVSPMRLGMWQGGWIENRAGHNLTLLLPAVDATLPDGGEPGALLALSLGALVGTDPVPSEPASIESAPSSDAIVSNGWQSRSVPNWTLSASVTLRSEDRIRRLELATASGAERGADGFDLGEPPSVPGAVFLAAFVGAESGDDGRFLRDVRPDGEAANWTLEVSGEGTIDIAFDSMRSAELSARLDDDPTWRPLSTIDSWVLPAGDHQIHIRFVPSDQNPGESGDDLPGPGVSAGLWLRAEPHPIRGDAVFFFSQSKPGRTTLSCFDVRGTEVFTEEFGELGAGTHLFRWGGTRSDGRQLEAGTYFARLSVGGQSVSQKIVVLP